MVKGRTHFQLERGWSVSSAVMRVRDQFEPASIVLLNETTALTFGF
jgi:hypothetical protein